MLYADADAQLISWAVVSDQYEWKWWLDLYRHGLICLLSFLAHNGITP